MMPQVPVSGGRHPGGQQARPAVVDDVMYDAVPQKSQHHAGRQSARDVE
jgi:hypothetical protein